MKSNILHTEAVSKYKGVYLVAALTAVLVVQIAPRLLSEVLR